MGTFQDTFNAKLEEAEIPLTDDVTFVVQLPTSAHKKYARDLMSVMTEPDGSGGYKQRELGVIEMIDTQALTFLRCCVVEVKGYENVGLGDTFDADKFVDAYPDASQQVYLTAQQEATKLDEVAAADAKKSVSTSRGKKAGVAKRASRKK